MSWDIRTRRGGYVTISSVEAGSMPEGSGANTDRERLLGRAATSQTIENPWRRRLGTASTLAGVAVAAAAAVVLSLPGGKVAAIPRTQGVTLEAMSNGKPFEGFFNVQVDSLTNPLETIVADRSKVHVTLPAGSDMLYTYPEGTTIGPDGPEIFNQEKANVTKGATIVVEVPAAAGVNQYPGPGNAADTPNSGPVGNVSTTNPGTNTSNTNWANLNVSNQLP